MSHKQSRSMSTFVSTIAGAALVAAGLVGGPLAAAASPPTAAPPADTSVGAPQSDELPNPAEDKRRALREEAVQQVLNGEATATRSGGSTVVKLSGKGRDGTKQDKFVEIGREKTDKIFVILTEFGDQRDPAYPDQDTAPSIPGPTVFNGPLHNAIPQPDRAVDNSTVWQADYNPAAYQKLYFGTGAGVESLKTYYEAQSSGRYSVDGQVSDWVKVPFNEARYGRSDGFPCASNVCSNTWDLVRDGLNQWVADQKSAGQSDAQIKTALASYDQWDRYDYDQDGVFNEPDGYIDHFQIVHSGGDQADGDPSQGEDAIWSHRWYAYFNQAGRTGPAGNLLGGAEIPGTGLWVGDYTIQPENGGLSVFAHEYGHDLGLPDDYDTAGGPSNNNEWWTLMSQSRLGAAGQALGEKPGDIGAWEKLQLGWLDYDVVQAGEKKTLQLGPEEYNSVQPQAAVVVLPKKTVTNTLVSPAAGTYEWWSGQGDNLGQTLARRVTLPAGAATLAFQANWNIEDCGPDACDYAYVEVNDGSGWTALAGTIANAAEGNGIDGQSNGWQPASFDLSAYAGKTVDLRFSYVTDGAAQGNDPSLASGIFIDEISISSGATVLFSDGAETLDPGWTANGFIRTTGVETSEYDNYYIAGNRSYVGYDRYLKTGPYNFGFANTKPDLVEHFAYQQGLMISYWDTSQSDNNVSAHPGAGRNLYVDAHPQPLTRASGAPWRNRIQLYDAPFSLLNADSFTLNVNSQPSTIRGLPAQPVFDDTKNWEGIEAIGQGVKVANAGVKIEVTKQKGTSMTIRISSTQPRT
ncbi:immune inhibitor A [Cryobacterium sp. PH31-AA6]|uniref:immune inhibitor A domain-containing protein n=1 Tax=Cryobacterium sp. PH31-AA6 TaxID=3046205 RepID=UPI0024B893C0|nr:immune inhibitor A domain-containing protein [Cryobacterium sp. PH31-AA6]MDJ0323978.1 immune inhibitor A [Cryobacterium sp. PH31-AA6]